MYCPHLIETASEKVCLEGSKCVITHSLEYYQGPSNISTFRLPGILKVRVNTY